MSEVRVNPGICGFETVIYVSSDDMQNAEVTIKTQCPNIKPMEQELKKVDAFRECFTEIGGDSEVFNLARKYCKHPACPIPSAIIKAIEVECELALPKDVIMEIKK